MTLVLSYYLKGGYNMNAFIALGELTLFVVVTLPITIPVTNMIMDSEWGKKFFYLEYEDDEHKGGTLL